MDRRGRDGPPGRSRARRVAAVAAALLVGWAVAWVAAPTNAWVVAALVAFLAGFVLMNVFNEELPHEPRRGHFEWFLAGVTSTPASSCCRRRRARERAGAR